MPKSKNEKWKDIPGYEGAYQVSDKGRVRSIDHYVRLVTRNGREITRLSPGKLLRPGVQRKSGHVTVALGKYNSKCVHYLVALAFIGPRPPGADVAHENGIPSDNRRRNISYKTRGENNKDVLRHKRRKLSLAQIKQIKRSTTYAQACVLADRFGVSVSHTYNIMHGRRSYVYIDA